MKGFWGGWQGGRTLLVGTWLQRAGGTHLRLGDCFWVGEWSEMQAIERFGDHAASFDAVPAQVLMVMEYAEGGAIVGPDTLSPERVLPEAMAQFYFRQMAAGLAYLHEHHVVSWRRRRRAGGVGAPLALALALLLPLLAPPLLAAAPRRHCPSNSRPPRHPIRPLARCTATSSQRTSCSAGGAL